MRSRHLILSLILLTLLATCLAAAAKLRATPKYDRIQVGMSADQVYKVLGLSSGSFGSSGWSVDVWECDEGSLAVQFQYELVDEDGRICAKGTVTEKSIWRRAPLERLWWLAGWR